MSSVAAQYGAVVLFGILWLVALAIVVSNSVFFYWLAEYFLLFGGILLVAILIEAFIAIGLQPPPPVND